MIESCVIKYAGHSTVFITTEFGVEVVIDPWLENPLCPESLKSVAKLDYILLTHGHSDHTGSVLRLAQETGAVVCATYELVSRLVADGVNESCVEYMNKGGNIPLNGGLRVALTNAFHSSSYTTKDGATVGAGEPCGVVLQLESGRTIYHAGDSCLFSDMALIGRRFKPAVAFLPIGDRFTMGPEDAAEATKLIDPSTVIPIHFGTFPALTGTPEEFANQLCRVEASATLKVLKPGQELRLGQ